MSSSPLAAPLALQQLEQWARSRLPHPSLQSASIAACSHVMDLREVAAPVVLKSWVAQAVHVAAERLRLRPIAVVAASSMDAPHTADGQSHFTFMVGATLSL